MTDNELALLNSKEIRELLVRVTKLESKVMKLENKVESDVE